MILQVPWNQFFDEVKAKVGPSAKIYLVYKDGQTIATASEPRLSFVIRSRTSKSNADILSEITQANLTTATGEWMTNGDSTESSEVCLAAVAYVSKDETPGLWVEAFPFTPDVSDVLRRMIAEFESEGALRNITSEEFRAMAKPNVVILTQPEIKALVEHFNREANDQMTTEDLIIEETQPQPEQE